MTGFLKIKRKIDDKVFVPNPIQTFFLGKYEKAFAVPITKFLSLRTNVTPNQATWIKFVIGLFSIFFFILGNYASIMIGALLYNMKLIFDMVDGGIARARNMKSLYGKYLDFTTDLTVEPMIVIGIAIGLYRATGNSTVWLLCLLAIFARYVQFLFRMFAWNAQNVQAHEHFQKPFKKFGKYMSLFNWSDELHMAVITVAAILNQLYWVLFLMATVGNLYWIIYALLQLRSMKESYPSYGDNKKG